MKHKSDLQGFLMSRLECIGRKREMARLWIHESRRVYRDKLTDEKDLSKYDSLEKEIVNKYFDVSFFKHQKFEEKIKDFAEVFTTFLV